MEGRTYRRGIAGNEDRSINILIWHRAIIWNSVIDNCRIYNIVINHKLNSKLYNNLPIVIIQSSDNVCNI